MKIICDNCGTKYSIADEKVKGKVFKIRCKKCQHIIVVRGTTPSQEVAAPAGDADLGAAAAFEDAGPSGTLGEAPTWHVVIDREQVGPMTAAEVQQRLAAGEINSDTYIWREGFGDWMRLGSVDEFAGAAEAAPEQAGFSAAAPAAEGGGWGASPGVEEPAGWGGAPAQDQAADAWGAQAPADDAFAPFGDGQAAGGASPFGGAAGGGGGQDLFSSAPRSEIEEPAAGAFAAPASAPAGEGGGGDLFGGVGGAAAADAGGRQLFPDEEPQQNQGDPSAQMTGQRGENSVLFSLANLQHLAMGSQPAAPSAGNGSPDAGSGLIDIRGMATTTAAPRSAAQGGGDDLPLMGFSAPVAPAPVLMPAVVEERPKWLLPTIIGGGGFLLVAITVLVVLLVSRKDPQPVPLAAGNIVNPETPTTAGASGTAGAATGATEKAAAETKPEDGAKDEGKTEEKPDDKPGATAAKPTRRGRSSGRRGGRRSSGRSRGGSPAATPAAPEKPKPRPRGGKRDALDDLIDGALGGGGGGGRRGGGGGRAKPKPKPAPSNLPSTLSRSQIQGGMRNVKGRVQGCYDKFKVPGLANVQVKIGQNGRVSTARVQGMFSGTPTGACVLAAVRSARFPQFAGAPITITYPFMLR